MKVEVKLFANLREYLPPGSKSYSCMLEIAKDATIAQVLGLLKIPESTPSIALVNGLHKGPEEILKEGDVLSVFPPVAGG